ncbi:MAG: hypothetical protein Q9157_001645 [Trypethelium eluteriae]
MAVSFHFEAPQRSDETIVCTGGLNLKIPRLVWRVDGFQPHDTVADLDLFARDQTTEFDYDCLQRITRLHISGEHNEPSPWISLTGSLLWALARANWLRNHRTRETTLLLIDTSKVEEIFQTREVKCSLGLGHVNVRCFNEIDHEYLAWRRIPKDAIIGRILFRALKNYLNTIYPILRRTDREKKFMVCLNLLRERFCQSVDLVEPVSPADVETAKTLGQLLANSNEGQDFLVAMAFLTLMPRTWDDRERRLIALNFEGTRLSRHRPFLQTWAKAPQLPIEIVAWVRGVDILRLESIYHEKCRELLHHPRKIQTRRVRFVDGNLIRHTGDDREVHTVQSDVAISDRETRKVQSMRSIRSSQRNTVGRTEACQNHILSQVYPSMSTSSDILNSFTTMSPSENYTTGQANDLDPASSEKWPTNDPLQTNLAIGESPSDPDIRCSQPPELRIMADDKSYHHVTGHLVSSAERVRQSAQTVISKALHHSRKLQLFQAIAEAKAAAENVNAASFDLISAVEEHAAAVTSHYKSITSTMGRFDVDES